MASAGVSTVANGVEAPSMSASHDAALCYPGNAHAVAAAVMTGLMQLSQS